MNKIINVIVTLAVVCWFGLYNDTRRVIHYKIYSADNKLLRSGSFSRDDNIMLKFRFKHGPPPFRVNWYSVNPENGKLNAGHTCLIDCDARYHILYEPPQEFLN